MHYPSLVNYLIYFVIFIGDRVLFTEAAATPGVPVVYRLPEDRQTNPDRLNLDRYIIQLDLYSHFRVGIGSLGTGWLNNSKLMYTHGYRHCSMSTVFCVAPTYKVSNTNS